MQSLAYLKRIEKEKKDVYQLARSPILFIISKKVTIKGSEFVVNHIKEKKSEDIIIMIYNNFPKRSKYILDN